MKRVIQLTLAVLLIWNVTAAQETIVYDFEDGMIPAEFTLINVDGLTPNEPDDIVFLDSAWIVIESGLLNSFAALSLSWYVNDAGPADDWMILPKLALSDGSILSWTAQSTTSSGNFPDSYQVLINTGEPTFDDFSSNGEILLTIDPEEHETAQMRQIDLSGYAGQEAHIAFRNITPSGDALLIDDITITNVVSTGTRTVDTESFKMSLLPNPASTGSTQLDYRLESGSEVDILIRDLTGRTLRVFPQGFQPAGQYRLPLQLEGLPAGAYIVNIRTEEKIGTMKLILR